MHRQTGKYVSEIKKTFLGEGEEQRERETHIER